MDKIKRTSEPVSVNNFHQKGTVIRGNKRCRIIIRLQFTLDCPFHIPTCCGMLGFNLVGTVSAFALTVRAEQ